MFSSIVMIVTNSGKIRDLSLRTFILWSNLIMKLCFRVLLYFYYFILIYIVKNSYYGIRLTRSVEMARIIPNL